MWKVHISLLLLRTHHDAVENLMYKLHIKLWNFSKQMFLNFIFCPFSWKASLQDPWLYTLICQWQVSTHSQLTRRTWDSTCCLTCSRDIYCYHLFSTILWCLLVVLHIYMVVISITIKKCTCSTEFAMHIGIIHFYLPLLHSCIATHAYRQRTVCWEQSLW